MRERARTLMNKKETKKKTKERERERTRGREQSCVPLSLERKRKKGGEEIGDR